MISIHTVAQRVRLLAALLMGGPVLVAQTFFTPPESPFIINSMENVSTLDLASGTVERAQSRIDASRPTQSNAVLVVRLSGTLEVRTAPLQLGPRTCLVLNEEAGIVAMPDAAAESLLEIAGTEFVSVSSSGAGRGVLDGRGRPLVGIRVRESGRVNIDHLLIRRCEVAGVAYTGRDADAVNDAGSVTRLLVRDCGDGLVVANTAGFMCLDNEFRDNRGTAIRMNSARSVIAGNVLIGNGTGVSSTSDHGVIARNRVEGNTTSLKLDAAGEGNLVTGNRSRGKAGDLFIGGRDNHIFGNELAAATKMMPGAEGNVFVNNASMGLPSSGPDQLVFTPPTYKDPHTNPVIVPGMGRFDLEIPGSANRYEPADLGAVQAGLIEAREAHANAIIVLRLQGHYISRTPSGLELPANSCVILDGTIRADLGTGPYPAYDREAPKTWVVRMSPEGYSSFSGGMIDGGRQAFHGIYATNETIALIDGVDVRASARDGIYTKGRGTRYPLFISGNSVSGSGGRGIWVHVAGSIHTIANVCIGNNQDGIDVDAEATDCTVLFNVSSGNRRHGVFVEEAVTNTIVFGNQLCGNNRSGVHVWNEAVPGNTGQNVIAANLCRANVKGVNVGGRAADRTACRNLFFNNVCQDNRDFGLASGNSKATDNYFSQFVLFGNRGQSVGSFNKQHYFFATPSGP